MKASDSKRLSGGKIFPQFLQYYLHRIINFIDQMFDLLFAENNPAGVKAFLAEMGLIENVLRLPLVPVSAPVLEKVRAFR